MAANSDYVRVDSPNVTYSESEITSSYRYDTTRVSQAANGRVTVTPTCCNYTFKTQRIVPRVGLMMVGWGGNNGSTVTAGILANKEGICWNTKTGLQRPDYLGSITQASTVRMGCDENGREIYVPMNRILPMVNPNDLVLGGWDINSANLADAMVRAEVLDFDLQRQLIPLMQGLVPLPSIYDPDFIASNQFDRANNVIEGTKQQQLDHLRNDIRQFKLKNNLGTVIVLWTANTERFCDVLPGLNDTEAALFESIRKNEAEISPSTLFAVASILEGCPYINGSPQNTFVPGVLELAAKHRVYIGGDDLKTGQTKIKSVLVDFLVSAGLKPTSIVSYNHLGNNDGKNLAEPKQFRSKEISKSNVVDDMVHSNSLMYGPKEKPDHCVVIKYVPYVGDSKRAMDEYTSRIFMNDHNTIVLHNTCEDSLLASPIILDLCILTELVTRITYKTPDMDDFEGFHSVLSVLSYLLKAPLVPETTPVINALFRQRACIENLLRACVGLPPDSNLLLEAKTATPSFAPYSGANGHACTNGHAHTNGHANGHVLANGHGNAHAELR